MISPVFVSRHVGTAIAMVDSTSIDGVPVSQWLEERLDAARMRPGRRRKLSVRAPLVALQLMAFDGEHYLRDVPDIFACLSPRSRKQLDLPSAQDPVTERQVLYLFSRIDAVLREHFIDGPTQSEESYRDFDRVVNALGTTGARPATERSKSIALDGSEIPSWGTRTYRWLPKMTKGPDGKPTPLRENGKVVHEKVLVISDPEARFRAAKKGEDAKGFFGYGLTAAVAVKDEGGPEVPNTVLAIRVRAVNLRVREQALACVGMVANRRGGLGDVLIDRGYTLSNHGRDFLLPVRAMGGEPVFDLNANQIGAMGTVRGAVIVGGRPYSPSLPADLYTIERPSSEATGVYKPNPDEVAAYEARIAQREQ